MGGFVLKVIRKDGSERYYVQRHSDDPRVLVYTPDVDLATGLKLQEANRILRSITERGMRDLRSASVIPKPRPKTICL